MTEATPLLALPYILPSQAQKHVTHNEALRMLDAVLHMRVGRIGLDTPPSEPEESERHVVGAAPTGAFAGHAGEIAVFQEGAWAFLTPRDGWTLWDAETQALYLLDDGMWIAAVPEPETLPLLGINTTADTTNRLATAAAATLLTHAGAGHQLKINKSAAGDTASLLFQTDWSGRAEMGLTGNDDFSVKVSADGSAWKTALRMRAADGNVGIGSEPMASALLEARLDQAAPAITRIAVNNPNATGLSAFSLYGGPGNVERGRMQYNHGLPNVFFTTIGSIPFYIGTNDTVRVVITANGSVNMTSGVVAPVASAKLQVDSTAQGFLPPRMTTTQRDAIASPAEGLIVYNTTAHQPQFWNGSAWTAM